MTAKSIVILQIIVVFYMIILSTMIVTVARAQNAVMEVHLSPRVPIVIQYDNRSIEVKSYGILKIPSPVKVCVSNYTITCTILRYDKVYISSLGTDNALFLIISQYNMSVKTAELKEVKFASGEGLIISIKIQGFLYDKNIGIREASIISIEKELNVTSLTSVQLRNNTLYVNVNYDKGRLPFIKFDNGDVIRISLTSNNSVMSEIIVLLKERYKETYSRSTVSQPYTRIAGSTSNLSSIIMTSRYGSALTRASDVYKYLINPLFLVTTLLLIMSIVILHRTSSSLNK